MTRRLPFSKQTYGYAHDYRWKGKGAGGTPECDAVSREASRSGIKFYQGDLAAELEALKTQKAQKAKEARERAKAQAQADRERKKKKSAERAAKRLAAKAAKRAKPT